MGKLMNGVGLAIMGAVAIATVAWADGITETGTCTAPDGRVAGRSMTEAVQAARYTIVDVHQASGDVVLRADSGFVYHLSCASGASVSVDGRTAAGLGSLVRGDIVTLPRAGVLTVLRRPWEETGNPEK